MGYIHSLETFGTVDGPGVRFVVFFQGCPMRCRYCHNPDTWNMEDGKQIEAEEIIEKFERNRSFYKTGGLTATGGEPMMQIEFLTELFSKAKEKGIHTCLDTSGIMFPQVMQEAVDSIEKINELCEQNEQMKKIQQLMAVTDLVMLDIKHIEEEPHKVLTKHSNRNILAFARYLDTIKKPVWIRHVVVPGITFEKKELEELGEFLNTLSNVEKLEVLPYHALGKVKYDNLGIDYVLKDTPQLTKAEAKEAEEMIRSTWTQQ
ncbi:MAG: pyruvate formate-lyase-activating protein [Roseburia sp.]